MINTLPYIASSVVSLQCNPVWNDTTDTYTVYIQWTITDIDVISDINFFYVDYSVPGVSGTHEELATVSVSAYHIIL